MPIDWNEVSRASSGGTEMMARALEGRADPALLDQVQIIPSRVRNPLAPDKHRVLWLHDCAEDPENDHLKDGGWRRFHRLVFVSNWSMQQYVAMYGIPWSKCVVLHNAIVPVPAHEKPPGPVRLVYTPTPHRGLNVLVAAFKELRKTVADVELEVFSSFNLYNWPERDKAFEPLYEELRTTPGVTYHGTASNEEVREALTRCHVFAYPSIWPETSCLCLIEAMSAGLVCVHPNLGALYETGAGLTFMYQFNEDLGRHAKVHHDALAAAVEKVRTGQTAEVGVQKSYCDLLYSWDLRTQEWDSLLRAVVGEPLQLDESPVFEYRVA